MRLTDVLQQNQVIADLKGTGKRAVMEELCHALQSADSNLDSERLMEVLIERERLGSTGIGDGIAIPHGKMENLDQLLLAFGRSKSGVEFDSLDGKPAYLFFLVVAPDKSAGIHLKALARISRLLKSGAVRKDLMEAKGAPEIFEVIKAQDEDF
jgi:PTS system nitrogen regulatory IIA component